MRCGLPERLECVNKGEEIIFSRSRRSGCDRKVVQRLSEQTSEIPVNKKFRHFPSRGCGSENQLSPRRNTDADCESFPINARKEFSPSQDT